MVDNFDIFLLVILQVHISLKMWYPCMHAVCGLTVLVTISNRLSLCASCQHSNSVMIAHIGSSTNRKLYQAYFYKPSYNILGYRVLHWLCFTIPNPYSTKYMPLRGWETLKNFEILKFSAAPETHFNSLGSKFSSQGHFHTLQLLNVPQFLFCQFVRLKTAPRGNFSHT